MKTVEGHKGEVSQTARVSRKHDFAYEWLNVDREILKLEGIF